MKLAFQADVCTGKFALEDRDIWEEFDYEIGTVLFFGHGWRHLDTVAQQKILQNVMCAKASLIKNACG